MSMTTRFSKACSAPARHALPLFGCIDHCKGRIELRSHRDGKVGTRP
jgi:hypothetical protein